jgi:hypothetical protein
MIHSAEHTMLAAKHRASEPAVSFAVSYRTPRPVAGAHARQAHRRRDHSLGMRPMGRPECRIIQSDGSWLPCGPVEAIGNLPEVIASDAVYRIGRASALGRTRSCWRRQA